MEQFGRYELRRRLGVGGMAEVYEAVAYDAEHGIEKPLVIKRILEEHSADPSFRAMFIDEARVAMRLNHPNVVSVFEFGKAEDRYFLAMELVRGKDLGALLSRARSQDRTVPAGVALYIAGEAAKGLDHAHRLTGPDGKAVGLVHRDVSPQNLLLSIDGAVKVGDFGIAKFDARKGKTQAATVRGKVRYMSPEQAEGETIDPRSDLFSLGVVLYEMITGVHAFDGRSDLDVLDAVRSATPKRPSEITSVPAELEAILMKVLQKDPRKRYARGNDLQRDLETMAASAGLRASSGALSEFLLALFPELEQRVSDARGETQIRKLPAAAAPAPVTPSAGSIAASRRKGEITTIRKVFEADGMPVFVSEEVRLASGDPHSSTHESELLEMETSTTQAQQDLMELPSDENTDRGYDAPIGSISPRAREPSVDTVVGARMPPFPPPAAAAPDRTPERRTQDRAPDRRTRGSSVRPVHPASEEDTAASRADEPRRPAPTAPSRAMPVPPPPPPALVPPLRATAIPEPSLPGSPLSDFGADRVSSPSAVPVRPLPVARRGAMAPLTLAGILLVATIVFFAAKWTPLGRSIGGSAPGDGNADDLIVGANQVGYLSLQGNTGDLASVDENDPIPEKRIMNLQLPVMRLSLSAGLHDVTVEGQDGFTSTFSVNIRSNETFTKTIQRTSATAAPSATPPEE